jgi:hypothetical protein
MGWTAPRTWVTGEIVTAAELNAHVRDNMNFLKSGVVASTTVTANVGPTSSTTELVVASAPAVTFDGTTQVEVMFSWYNVTLTVATDSFKILLYDGPTAGSGTNVAQWLLTIAANGGSGVTRAILTPSAASHTYTARLVRNSGTGTATLIGSAVTPAVISVAQVN